MSNDVRGRSLAGKQLVVSRLFSDDLDATKSTGGEEGEKKGITEEKSFFFIMPYLRTLTSVFLV